MCRTTLWMLAFGGMAPYLSHIYHSTTWASEEHSMKKASEVKVNIFDEDKVDNRKKFL